MPSRISWKHAQRPNYLTNVDKTFPYSEVPFIGEYNLVRLPVPANELIDHVDYWGEGRIVTEAGVSGFSDCYNVNHEYQLVSNGSDTNKKIPNRIPVLSYTDCDTSGYIRGNSVKTITLMGAPINKSCAQDVVRIVNDRVGKVFVFDFQEDSAYIRNLEEELENKTFVYCPDYVLPSKLLGLTLFNTYRAYLNAEDTQNELYSRVASGNFDGAVTLSTSIIGSGHGSVIKETVTKLLKSDLKSVMKYGYKLLSTSSKDIAIQYFPEAYKLLFSQAEVTITNKQYNLALKLDANVDSYNDRLVWGDAQDKTSSRVVWKFLPVWNDQALYFKIMNMEHSMYLKLDVNVDEDGDRKAWGSNSDNEERHQWILEPVLSSGSDGKAGDEIVFYIINRAYAQGLKLGLNVDSYGDRLLWGNRDPVFGNTSRYGWIIETLNKQ